MTTTPSNPIRVSIPQNGSVAELVIGPVDDPASVTIDLAVAALRASEVEMSDDVRDRAQALIDTLAPCAVVRGIVAMATPPVHGEDGVISWDIPEPDPTPQPASNEDSATRADHYNRSRYTMVNAGQKLGAVIDPTPGIDGRDVRGRRLVAKSGKPARIKLDESIILGENGALIAQRDGILSRSSIFAAVRDHLAIEGYVDFSTGNVAFSGDVSVERGIRDLFTVEAKGNIEVGGLIEAADIRCGGDLIASGGMAGRERGSIRTGGDFTARYLDAANIEVGGVLRVEREMLNCEVIVHSRVEASAASVIGGRLQCTGAIRVGSIGSTAGRATTIVVYTVPLLEPRRAELLRALHELADAQHAIEKRLADLAAGGSRLTKSDKARQEELAIELHTHSERVAKCNQSLAQVEERIRRIRTVDVRADRAIYSGARFVIEDRAYVMRMDLKGPVTISRGKGTELVFRQGETGAATPLASVANIRADDPADDSRAAA